MPKFFVKFNSNVVGYTNKVRRHIEIPENSEKKSCILHVNSPEDLRKKLTDVGNSFHKQVNSQITFSILWLNDVDRETARLYWDVISGTEWNWITEWINDKTQV